jgi:hypothetical protein
MATYIFWGVPTINRLKSKNSKHLKTKRIIISLRAVITSQLPRKKF